ncbi:hypothetical protein OQY15_04635 [Pedobacter sp. MC2016-15]|uniref:hypothetical protein n=1 Tax=Pedobacter sp. MC2016-15 TaxID=2994473 RepID=UPI002245B932|nr:hypothetical protein [Pedobacter sp. MC2016-15]MCX2478364.1 hypothetical protein [Pedobacter sp. MC2016-15]
MSTKKTKSPKDSSEKAQSVPVKYTYADLSNFHRTVLAILNHNVPNTLDVPDLKIVQQYLCIITALLETPYLYLQFAQETTHGSSRPTLHYATPKIKGIGAICKLKKCLKALIIWMTEVIEIENLTLEILLDEYYTKFPYALKPPTISEGNPPTLNLTNDKNLNSGKPQ